MNQPDKARTNAANALLRLIQEYEGPYTEEQRAHHVMDAICYYVSVVYQLPIPKQPTLREAVKRSMEQRSLEPSPLEEDCIGMMGSLIDQIRDIVDEDTSDPAQWYKIILKVRDLVGVTR